jgi:hypothetical protein
MKKILFFFILFANLDLNAETVSPNNNNHLLECSPSFKLDGDIASTGVCQFGDYQIEFFKNLKASTAHLCKNKPFCGLQADWKGADSYIDTIVTDLNGNIVATNLVENVDAIELNNSSFNSPYLVLQTKRPGSGGPGGYFHLYTSFPEFKKIIKIGPLWNSKKGIYTNESQEVLVDIWVKDLPPDIPSLSNSVSYPITLKLIDNKFFPAVDHMKKELKDYNKNELEEINNKADQINAIFTKYILNENNELEEFKRVRPGFLLGDIYQLGFMRTIIELVREGRIDLAWEFYDRAIPASYDSREEYNLPIYKNKRIMKETINNWLTNLDYWTEIEQLNLNTI